MDAIIGTTAIDRIVETVDSVLAGKSENHLEDIDRAAFTGFREVLRQADILRI